MRRNQLKNSLAQTRLTAASLLLALTICSCSIEPIRFSEDSGKNPAVATAPQVGDSPFNAAVAWQGSPEDDNEEATQIFVKLLPEGATHTVDGIISPTAVPHPVQLVRAGDHYFLAWIDNTEPPARLRWQILSANDLTPTDQGEYRPAGKLVSHFAAAGYHDEATVLVAILARPDAALDEYKECVEDGVSSCKLSWITVDANSGERLSEGFYSRGGIARGVSVAAGANGFLIAVAESTYGVVDTDTNGNRVKIYPFDAEGGERTTYAGFVITGANDCSDDPQGVVDAVEILQESTAYVVKDENNFRETAIAYDTNHDRYLVGYTTACDNQYFRARWVHQAGVSDGWVVYGIAEGAYTTAGSAEKTVIEPPFELATYVSGDPISISAPMLAYNASSSHYIAGFSSSWNLTVLPAGYPTRRSFYRTRLEDESFAKNCFPGRIASDRWEDRGTTFADFVSGSITAETEGDGRKTFYVWEQKDIYVPCLEPSEDYCAEDALDFENAEPSTRSTLYFTYQEPRHGITTCDDVFNVDPDERDPGRDPNLDPLLRPPHPITPP